MPKSAKPDAAKIAAKRKELLSMLGASAGAKPPTFGPKALEEQAVHSCLATIADKSKPPRTRAEFLLLFINEVGYDLLEPLAAFIGKLDSMGELEQKVAALEKEAAAQELRPLQPELFLRSIELPEGPAHLLLTQVGPMVAPVSPKLAKKLGSLRCGDYVLVDRGSGMVVGRDGALAPVGEIVTIEQVPEADDAHAVVKIRDELSTAYVSDEIREDPGFEAGARVVWDPARQFLHRVVDDRSDGTELLTPSSQLSEFTLDSLGAPHPVLDRLLRLVKRLVRHPEWVRRMKVRERCSYLFYGPTGTGKSCTIKVLVNLVADWLEELTGERETRVVFCDASDFYSPYFGEAERRITEWFKKLSRVARQELIARNGRKIRVPLIVVFEEIEGLVRQRGEYSASSHLFDRVLSMILRKMDDVKNDLDVPLLVISTTNMKSLIDTAGKRRFGQREARFGMLNARAAYAVLEKKIPEDIAFRIPQGRSSKSVRERLLKEVLYYLFGDQDDQILARATLRDGAKVDIRRRDVVSGAVLEMAVSQAIDVCLDRSEEIGELVGLDAESVITAVAGQFQSLAGSLDRHNVLEYVPHLFESADRLLVTDVKPVRRPEQRAALYGS